MGNKYTFYSTCIYHPTVTIPLTEYFSCLYISVYFSSSLTHSSVKSFSDNWLGQPQSSHPHGWMKENDIKIKWEWPPRARMALRWRNPSPAPDSLDILSPEEAPGRRLTSSTTLQPPLVSLPELHTHRDTQSLIRSLGTVPGEGLSRPDTSSIDMSPPLTVEKSIQLSVKMKTVKDFYFCQFCIPKAVDDTWYCYQTFTFLQHQPVRL